MKNKVTLAISTFVLCSSVSTAHAAKHHSISHHSKHTATAHKTSHHALSSHHHSQHAHTTHHQHHILAAHRTHSHDFASNSNTNSGMASLYSTRFQGRKTASGEPYDMFEMTAAHRTLPLGSYVEVTNLDNNQSVIVRINDRGPFHGNRMLDLSTAAAEELDMGSTGRVKITPVAESVAMNEFSDDQ
jgi:rare lipoprotein A